MTSEEQEFLKQVEEHSTEGGPAFPVAHVVQGVQVNFGGMKLRDYFAAKAMQGRMAGTLSWHDVGFNPVNGLTDMENEGVLAYRMADAMLKARES